MQMLYTMNCWVAVGCAFVLGALFGWLAPRTLRTFSIKRSSGTEVRALAARFDERLRKWRSHVQTLSDHSNEYTMIFCGPEWHELIKRVEHYETLNLEIKRCLTEKSFDDAQAILNELYDPRQECAAAEQSNIAPLGTSTAWEDSVRGMLKSVMCNLEMAAHETRRLHEYPNSHHAYSPSRKRTSTLVTLGDIKKSLLEEESLKREQ